MTPSLLLRRAGLLSLIISIFLTATTSLAAAQTSQEAGVQTHLMWGEIGGSEVDRQLDKAREAGASIVRVDVGWASVEPSAKGEYSEWYLKRLDAVVDKAKARGIKVLVTLWETPCWASVAPESLKQNCSGEWWARDVQRYPPRNPADYGDALAYMVKRYGDRVAAWEIWNEPNDAAYFKADDPVARYAELVKAGYPAAKAANPQATVLAGSLAHADFGWTRKLLDKGVADHFDGWSIHPYSGPRSPLDRGDDNWIQASFMRGVPAVRAELLRRGQDKPLWLTEFGWSTCSVRDGEEWARCISPAAQATFLRQAFAQMRTWDYVKAGFYFKLQDTSADGADRNTNYGLLRHDGSEKPAFAAFSAAVREVTGGGPLTDPASITGPGPGDQGPTPGSGTGTKNSGTKGFGATPGAASGRVTLQVLRSRKRVLVKGKGTRRRVVQIRAYRYIKAKSGYAAKASHTVSMRIDSTGRYARVLKKASLRRGRWRFTASLVGTSARLARVDVGARR